MRKKGIIWMIGLAALALLTSGPQLVSAGTGPGKKIDPNRCRPTSNRLRSNSGQ